MTINGWACEADGLPTEFVVATGLNRGNGRDDLLRVAPNLRPAGRRQHDDRHSAIGELLLMAQILVGGDQNVKRRAFRSRQQLPVAHRRPPTLVCRTDGVSGQRVPQRDGRALVEQDRHRLGRRPAQPSGGRQTVFSVGEDGQDLIARDAGEPLQEVVDGGARFQVLEQGAHGDARLFEDPGAADPVSHPFNDRTRLPIQHAVSIEPFAVGDNVGFPRRRDGRAVPEGDGR